MKRIGKFLKDEFLTGWTPFQIILLLVALTLQISLGFTIGVKEGQTIDINVVLSVLAPALSFVGVMLGAKQRISTFILGPIGGAMFAYLSFATWNNMSNFIFQVGIGIPSNFLGFFLWFKNRDNKGQALPKRMSAQGIGVVIALFISFYLTYGFLTQEWRTGGTNSISLEQHWIDALVLAVMIFASVIMLGRYVEQWYFWILANFAQIALYSVMIATISKDSSAYGGWMTPATAAVSLVGYIASQINAIYGWLRWFKYYKTLPKYKIAVLTKEELNELNVMNKLKYQTNRFFTYTQKK
ncbi:nicotinamide riboside transporter PnuC [Mesoplasma photuris]|uniref:nicotinamide riboside transporter PnuC n=1 Tax=Mesoplasma photuris TaxID=217731 RepID=UPI0004E26EEE|nr:nicotinamide riboside transporter PnuC [Mesoplasma photuris]